mgnify:CR=1 FL=1|tara:strand:- start:40 stop:831 length:792 start_codon:yes stop_codon:yes gene_type:complete
MYQSNLKELQRAAGRFDAMQATYELSLRLLERHPQFSSDRDKFFEGAASFGPRVNIVDLSKAREVNSQLYALGLFSLFEEFLFTLNLNVATTCGSHIFSTSAKIQHAIDALPLDSDDWQTKKRVLHYYRLVRNLPAHPFSKNNTRSEIFPISERLNSKEETKHWRPLLEGEDYVFPSYGEVLFDDCIICSRLLKAIAEDLVIKPAIQGEHDFSIIRRDISNSFSQFGIGNSEFRKRAIARLRADFCLGDSAANALYVSLFSGV